MTVPAVEPMTFTADTPYVCGWDAESCCSTLNEADETLAQNCVNAAAEVLYALSGRQFGLCEVTVRPCRPSDASGTGRWTPALINGKWYNFSCGRHGRDQCSCTEVCEVVLPGPVDSIVEVLLDGEILDPCAYRVDNRNRLVRVPYITDGEDCIPDDDERACWPLCQNMSADTSEEGTWEVTYLRGLPLPQAGKNALGVLACELCKACIGDSSCCLPSRVTSIVRQGLSMALLDPMEFLAMGRTGIYAVDLWLAAVNPQSRSRNAGVFSPDVEVPRTTSWQ